MQHNVCKSPPTESSACILLPNYLYHKSNFYKMIGSRVPKRNECTNPSTKKRLQIFNNRGKINLSFSHLIHLKRFPSLVTLYFNIMNISFFSFLFSFVLFLTSHALQKKKYKAPSQHCHSTKLQALPDRLCNSW